MEYVLFSSNDLYILPIFLVIIYFIANIIFRKNRTNLLYRKYFFQALTFKLIMVFLFAVIMENIGVGDVITYYREVKKLFLVAINNPEDIFELQFFTYSNLPIEIKNKFPSDYFYTAYSDSTAKLINYALPGTLLGFGSYFGSAIIFSMYAFSGSWKLFTILCKRYANLHRDFAIGLLFFPSVVFWSSGLFKDPVSFGGVVYLIAYFIQYFILQEKKRKYIFYMILNAFIVYQIKSYNLFGLLPFFAVYLVIKSKLDVVQKSFLSLFIFVPLLVAFFNPDIMGYYSADTLLENVQGQAESYSDMNKTHVETVRFDGSLLSIFNIIKAGILNTYYSPFPWEIKNPLMAISGIENFIVYYFTIRVFALYFKTKNSNIDLFKNNEILMLLLPFSIFMGIMMGITNPNLGTLSRYRISVYPFFLISIFIIINHYKSKQKIIKKHIT